MRILQIVTQLPHPPDSGGRAAVLGAVAEMGRRHRITLVGFSTSERDGEAVRALERHCERVVAVPRAPRAPARVAVAALLRDEPHPIAPFASAEMRRAVADVARQQEFDLAQIEFIHMARYAAELPPALPRLLRQHNVESAILERFAPLADGALRRRYVAWQAARLRRYEARALALFDRCVAMTEVDAAALRALAPAVRVDAVPAGVDLERFRPGVVAVSAERLRVATTGDYSWAPTADGLRFLVEEVWPRVRAAEPSARLSVVGRAPPTAIAARHGRDGVEVRGPVPDVRPEILRASVFAVPTRAGSGLRIKVLEAMALGRAVVSTPVGCEGIEARPGEHLRVASGAESLAAEIVRLLRDSDEAARLGRAAAAHVASRYGWPQVGARLDRIYSELVSAGPGRRRRARC